MLLITLNENTLSLSPGSQVIFPHQTWEDYDLILTSDPELLSKVTIFTILIKYNTEYNKNSKITWNVDTFKEFNELIKKEIK